MLHVIEMQSRFFDQFPADRLVGRLIVGEARGTFEQLALSACDANGGTKLAYQHRHTAFAVKWQHANGAPVIFHQALVRVPVFTLYGGKRDRRPALIGRTNV